ncbi:MAG: 50S ribosomal protein L6 [Parcubacteria group bacterium]|nr:50S ribosomal protein L6 [Parcubacteria group bacterium]
MSKLAKKPIAIPEGVAVDKKEDVVEVKGPKGGITLRRLPFTDIALEDKGARVLCSGSEKQVKANCGTMWALLRNALVGVSQGFQKSLEIEGVGYRAALEGKTLVLNVGFSHPVRFSPPEGIEVKVDKNVINISGIDKDLVGRAAAQIRAIKKPEPYKGKGIRYQGEVIRRKAGKKVAGTTA